MCIHVVGFPPSAELAQLVLSWKPRHSASTASVYCQTTVTGDITSSVLPDTTQPAQQPNKKKHIQTISERLKLRDSEAATLSLSDGITETMSHRHATTADCVLVTDTDAPSIQPVSTVELSSGSSVPSGPAVQLCDDGTSAICNTVCRSESASVSVTTTTACQSQDSVNSHYVTVAEELASDVAAVESSQRMQTIDEATASTSCQPSSLSPSATGVHCYTETACSLVHASVVSSSHPSLLLPSNSQPCPAAVPTTATAAYRVTEKVAAGNVLLNMDIGSSILGPGLIYGTFVYHGGQLVLGQQRQRSSAPLSMWPVLPDVGPCQAPVCFVAGSRPVITPSTNFYTVTVPSEALLGGLRLVCGNAGNVVGDGQLPGNASDVQSGTSLAAVAVDVTKAPRTVDSICEVSLQSGQPNSDADEAEVVADALAAGKSSVHGEDCAVNNSTLCSSVTAPITATSSSVDSIWASIHSSSATAAKTCELAAVRNEVFHVTVAQVIPPSSAETQVSQVSGIAISPSAADTATMASSMSLFASLPPGGSTVCSETSVCESSDVPLSAVAKQAQPQGVKRKTVPQLACEYAPKTKIGRMEPEKRVCKYICPPPDSASDRDGEIIHVMDQFCDKSLEQYLCPAHNHVGDSLQSATKDHGGVVNALPTIVAQGCNSSVELNTSGVSSCLQPSSLNVDDSAHASQFSSCFGTADLSCQNQSRMFHFLLHENTSKVDAVPTGVGKGFALANFLSDATTPSSVPLSSSSQQYSGLEGVQASKTAEVEKRISSALNDHVQTQNHNAMPFNKISNPALPCDTVSTILPDDLSLTDNDFAMMLSDTDDSSMFSFPRKSADNSYWSFGFGSVCSRLRDRTKDGPGTEHVTAEDPYHSFVPVFREQNGMPVADYLISDHNESGGRVGFNVSSLTCKTTSVCHSSLSTQIANSFPNSTLCHKATRIPTVLQHSEAEFAHAASSGKLQETSHVADVACSAVQSSARGIFSLAHHAIQPASKSCTPDVSNRSVSHTTSVLWSPCNGTAPKSSLCGEAMPGEHGQSLTSGHQCRLPPSAIGDVRWRFPEPSSFAPLSTSWDDNLYRSVQPLARPRPFVDQTASTRPGTCNVQSVFNRQKLYPVSETDQEKFRRKLPPDDETISPFAGNKNKQASRKHDQQNCQFSSNQKVPGSSSSQPLWTYSECGIAPQSYLSTSRGWLPMNNSETAPGMTFDLSLSVPATSCLPTSSCRLPSFSFATVPPVPDFLSLSFSTTTTGTNARTGCKASTWPVIATAAGSSAPHGWSPIFPQQAALHSQHVRSTDSSLVTTMSNTPRPDTCTDTVPSFIHVDEESSKQATSLNTHLPSLWHGTECIPVEMCRLPPVSVVGCDPQLLPIHGRGLYSSGEAGFVTNTLTSPPLHHHPMYSSQQAGLYNAGDSQLTFDTPFSLPRLPLTSQVLNFSASFETGTRPPAAVSSAMYCVHNAPVQARTTEDDDGHRSLNVSQSQPPSRPTGLKRASKYQKQLKHNATSLCVGYPPSQSVGTVSQTVAGDIPTYLPAGPFVGGTLHQMSSDYQVGASFSSVFGSCSLRNRLAGGMQQSLVASTAAPQTNVSLPNQRHNFDIGAFISDLPYASHAVTTPAAVRRLDFPTPPVHVLQQRPEQCQLQVHRNQLTSSAASDPASHNFGLHSMSINTLLGDNLYPGFAHRYETHSDNANHSAPTYDVPTLNFNIRSQTSAVNYEHTHSTKGRRN